MENDGLYTVAFWAKVDGREGRSRQVRVTIGTAYVEVLSLVSTDWKEYSLTFPATGVAGGVAISVGISHSATDFWLDDFRFFQGTLPDELNTGDEFIMGDVNGDSIVNSFDAALVLQFASELMRPTQNQELAADMNGDGNIGSNDAILILRGVAGLAAPGINNGGLITAALAEDHRNESLTVSLVVDNVNALAGGDFQISYDSKALRPVGVSSEPGMLLVSNIAEPGIVKISFVNIVGLDSETLVRIQFHILNDAAPMPTIRSADLYNPEGMPLISRSMNRESVPMAENSVLLQNFPNPFNPDTWIPYQLKKDNEVTIRIFNIRGNVVRELDLGFKSAGLYLDRDSAIHWDGRNDAGEQVSSGVYFYSISAGEFSAVRKLTIRK